MAGDGNAPPDSPQLTGIRYVGDGLPSVVLTFRFHGVCFEVVAASPEDEAGGEALVPSDYRFHQSLEGKILTEIDGLSWDDFDDAREAKDRATDRLVQQLAKLAAEACLPTMLRLAPTPRPDAQTLQDSFYPETYTLQVLTDFGGDDLKLTCSTIGSYAGISERHPPVSTERLCAMGLDLETTEIPVVKASQVILDRRLQGLIWEVTVGGEKLICKASIDIFEHAVGDELETYLKIRSANVALRVPELKGIVVSHRGVIGILLGYIPHKHHNLRALLAGVEAGAISPSEATECLRRKWAMQIRETLGGLHSLGILWRDIKTDNVLVNEDGDAVVIDFGGGNTMGWVDRDKYGTMEGEEQGLQKIMKALGLEIGV